MCWGRGLVLPKAKALKFQAGQAKRNNSHAILDTLKGTYDHQEQQQQEI